MKLGETLRINYDHDLIEIIDMVNKALEEHGLRFEDDDQYHDGYNILTLKRVEPST